MLKYAVENIRPPHVDQFSQPVDIVANKTYPDYIFHPMDLGTIKKKEWLLA